jgi:CO/xanthine dehydrogenase FAD-binding subunit
VYIKHGRNKLSDLSLVGVTVYAKPDPQLPGGFLFRIILASVAPVPLEASEAEAYLNSHPITPDVIHQAAILTAGQCKPIDDVRSSARYRKAMVKNLAEKALSEVWKKLHQ